MVEYIYNVRVLTYVLAVECCGIVALNRAIIIINFRHHRSPRHWASAEDY